MIRHIFLLLIICFTISCTNYAPRPQGYFRIATPEPTYTMYWNEECGFGFELSEFAEIRPREQGKCWLNIVYPFYKGEIHGTYRLINNDFHELTEDVRSFVYKPHTGVADAIAERFFGNPEKRVYGMLYELKGNTASPIQFMLTDSVNFLFRGALYFDASPNKDSIAPVAEYIGRDIIRLMESFEHK